MQSKLEELARKEEELRRINEALDVKKNKIMTTDIAPKKSAISRAAAAMDDPDSDDKDDDVNDDKSSQDSFDQFKGKNLAGAGAAADNNLDEDDNYSSDGNFENDGAVPPKKTTMIDTTGKAAADSFNNKFEFKMDDDDDIAATVAAGRRAAAAASNDGDAELSSSMYAELKRKYDDLLASNREQDKTINF